MYLCAHAIRSVHLSVSIIEVKLEPFSRCAAFRVALLPSLKFLFTFFYLFNSRDGPNESKQREGLAKAKKEAPERASAP